MFNEHVIIVCKEISIASTINLKFIDKDLNGNKQHTTIQRLLVLKSIDLQEFDNFTITIYFKTRSSTLNRIKVKFLISVLMIFRICSLIFLINVTIYIYIYLNLLEIIENLFSFYQILQYSNIAIINRNVINRFDKEINKILILSYYTFYVTDNLY